MSESRSRRISEITQLEEQLMAAMRCGDMSVLESIFAEEFVFLGSDGSNWGKDKALEDFRNPGYELSKLEIEKHKVTVIENTAIVTGISSVEGHIGKGLITGRYLFMRVWSRTGDGWKVSAVITCNAEKEIQRKIKGPGERGND